MTVTGNSAESAPQLAVTVTVSPWEAFDFIVTLPVSETVATLVSLLFQVTAPVIPVSVAPSCPLFPIAISPGPVT